MEYTAEEIYHRYVNYEWNDVGEGLKKSENVKVYAYGNMKKLFILIFTLLALKSNAQLNDGYTFEVGTNLIPYLGQTDYLTSTAFSDDGIYQFVSVRSGKVILLKWNGFEYEYQGVIIEVETRTVGEYGLIRVNYNNGYLDLFYTEQPQRYFPNTTTDNYLTCNVVVRYKFENETATYQNHVIGDTIEEGFLALGENHNGGDIAYDEDGYLFSATGDGGNWTYKNIALAFGYISQEVYNNGVYYISMTLSASNGKVFRVDPNTGEGHPDNPFYDANNPKSVQSRVYAMGFRNPWRLHYANGVLYVADVGAQARETVHAITEGGTNVGWSMYEGFDRTGQTGNAINPDEGIAFKDLLQEPTSFDYGGLWTKHVNSFDYGRSTNTTRLPYFEDGELELRNANANFEGASVVGGVVKDDKYWFMDSYRDWIGVADLSDTEAHFTEVNTIGNIGQNSFVHIVENPLDGSLWFTALFKRVWRLSYEETLGVTDFEYFKEENLVGYYDLLGREVNDIKPNTIYIALYELNGIKKAKKILKNE